jgi:hypothetical protein
MTTSVYCCLVCPGQVVRLTATAINTGTAPLTFVVMSVPQYGELDCGAGGSDAPIILQPRQTLVCTGFGAIRQEWLDGVEPAPNSVVFDSKELSHTVPLETMFLARRELQVVVMSHNCSKPESAGDWGSEGGGEVRSHS